MLDNKSLMHSIAKLNHVMIIISVSSCLAFILAISFSIWSFFGVIDKAPFSMLPGPNGEVILPDNSYIWVHPILIFTWIWYGLEIILLISNLVIKIILIIKLNEFSRYNSKAQTSWILLVVSIFIFQKILAIISYFQIRNMLAKVKLNSKE
ncbi:hypothetical protein [Mycoplasmopsis gallopavonis]|uniref:Uncharacterized protein n=1 Tax=Mycoplasmopsis gallopavonis TaxID=76629 RepID=A0A449AYX1_9BACT|nr:hypothetical protein [Mycoplasmopsis gallopavonis]RIV16488.1 hypothetical protein D1113_02180 [Mycoplasmopsis gallopavonis]VEU72677.1 Uncharacterised protein [Mycoplasmopsis gallopavonis]